MTKWTIYDRNGKARCECVVDYTGDENRPVRQDTLEYTGKWMGECFLTVSIKSPYPIDFQIGDYIDYRGERFTINYDPTVIKKARRGTYGEGFTYDSIKFNSYSNELTEIMFHDWVLSDNKYHYTSLPNFSFYCKDVDDLADRLQANTDRWCKANGFAKEDYWMFYTLRNNTTTGTKDEGQSQTTYERTLQRAQDISKDETFIANIKAQWEKVYGIGDNYKDSRDDERYDRTITASTQSVWDMMTAIKQQFGLNFIIRGRNVYIGTAGVPTSHLFEYGKDKGLYEVDKTADQDQKVVTKLHAYGSDENLPTRYYADLGKQVGCKVKEIIQNTEDNGDPKLIFNTDLPFSSRYFNDVLESSVDADKQLYKVAIKLSSASVNGYVYADADGNTEFLANKDTEPNEANLKALMQEVAADAIIYFTNGVRANTFSSSYTYYIPTNLPDNMAVNFLMLPGFPNHSLKEICRAVYDEKTGTTNYYITNPSTKKEVLFHTESGNHVVIFSDNKYDPFILSPNADSLGVIEGDIFCNEENDDNGLKKVYPTIEEITDIDAGTGDKGIRLDAVVQADKIDDNGVYPNDKTDNIKGFNIYIPALGFDLRQAAKDAGGSEMKISMKNGFCGGRTFDVANCEEVKSGDLQGCWKLDCKRTPDNDLDLYFPYSYAASVDDVDESMTDAYQVLAGDNFVLTGIAVSDVNYIWAASVKLLRKAIHWLCKNDYTRYVYNPKIDEIYMARQDMAAKADATGNTISLHDTLKEGDMLLFGDDDLRLSGAVYIDQLTIKENGNNGIPTYDVTLRNEIQVGTIQRIQNQVDSIRTDINNGNIGGSGGGVAPTDVDPLVKAYGAKYFLSKLNPDTAQKLITFLEGIAVGDGKYGIDGKGAATLAKVIADEIASEGYVDSVDQGIGKGFHLWQTGGTSNMQVDNLTVRGKWTAALLEVMKLQYSAGNITFDGAGGEIYAVVPYDADGKEVTDNAASAAYYRCYFKATDGDRHIQNEWHLGDQARCQTFNLTDGTYTNSANRSYFRVVRNVGKEVTQYNGVDCFYIDLSNLQNDSFQADTSVGDIHAGDIVRFRGIMHDKADDGTVTWAENDVPQKGDNIAHLGNVYDTDRQGAVQIIAVGETKGLIIYDGINEALDNLSRFAQIQWSPKSSFVNTQKFLFTNGHTANHPYIQCGEWEEGTTAHPSEVWQYDGASWVCNNETANAPSYADSDWSVLAARGKTVEAYDVALSRYQGAVSVDSRGNIMGGLYTVSQNGVKQWLLSSTVYVRKGTDILLEEDEGSEEVTKGHYRVTAFSDDCTCEVHNSTVYITGIRNLIGGDDTDKDIDLVAMRDMAFCKVSIVLDLEGVASKTVEFSICVTHDGIDGITYDVDPTVETAAVAIQSSGDDISKNITVSGKLSVDCEYKVYKKTGDKRSDTPETDIKLSAAFDDGTTKGLTVSGMNVKGSNIDYSSTDSRKAVVVTFKKGSDTIAVRNVPITLNPATQITDDAKKYQLIKANGDNVSALQVTADGISAKVDKINSDLLATGIDITNKKIMLTADKTTFQTNDGKEIAVFDKDGIIAHKVTSVGDDGRKVVIEDGILSVFGTNGVANIRFGVDEAGNSILSYYDNNGNFLYDLGPTGLDNSRLKEARVITYTVRQITNKAIGAVSEMKDYPVYFTQTDANGTVQGQTQQDFSVATILEDYNAIFNGISMSKHTGTVENVTTIMQYYAGRMNGTIVADTNRNLTVEEAQKYDGKFFTAEVFDDAHLVSGRYCGNIIYDAANDIMSTYDASTGLTSSPSSGQYPCSYVLVTTYNNGVAGGVTQTVGNRGPAKIYSRMTYDVSKSTI